MLGTENIMSLAGEISRTSLYGSADEAYENGARKATKFLSLLCTDISDDGNRIGGHISMFRINCPDELLGAVAHRGFSDTLGLPEIDLNDTVDTEIPVLRLGEGAIFREYFVVSEFPDATVVNYWAKKLT